MLKANVFKEAACYSTPAARKGIVSNILYASYRIFNSTSRIQRINDLLSLKFDETSFERIHKTISTLDSAVLDATKIILCFENFFKAELLSYGYIVHNIDSKADSKKYKQLAKDQKIHPIKLAEIRKQEGLQYKRGNDYSYKSMKNTTLIFSAIIKNETYKRTFRLEKKLFIILEGINKQRNNLHLMIGETSHFNENIINDYKYLINVVNNRIISKHNKLCDELNFHANARIKTI